MRRRLFLPGEAKDAAACPLAAAACRLPRPRPALVDPGARGPAPTLPRPRNLQAVPTRGPWRQARTLPRGMGDFGAGRWPA